MSGKVTFIPPHLPFLETLADHLLACDTPASLAQHTVLLPTQRACLKLRDILCRKSPNQTVLLPKLMPLGLMEEDALALESFASFDHINALPDVIGEEERLMHLTDIVQNFYQKSNTPLKTSQACQLASQLIQLINQVQTEGLEFDALKSLVPEDYATHWQITLRFLEIIGKKWPQTLKTLNKIERADYHRRLLELRTQAWENNPPTHPVIAAGSTGSIPATANLLKVISKLPKGMVILPGFDPKTPQDVASSHPQHTMQNLLKALGISQEDVHPFKKSSHPQAKLLRQIFSKTPELLPYHDVQASLQTLKIATCSTQQEEATVIALSIREALETPKKTVALITPDRTLAQRVVLELKRWKIRANDSGGTPFCQTPLGIFVLLTAEWIQESLPNVTLLATLKHPYAQGFKLLAQNLEKSHVRQGIPFERAAPPENLQDTFQNICAFMREGHNLSQGKNTPFKHLLSFHERLLEHLLGAEGFEEEKPEFEALKTFLENLKNLLDLKVQSGEDYAALLKTLLQPITVRQRYALHPRLTILGLIEARLIPADFVILGGLNESSWPPKTSSDPWFNQAMRKEFGLPDHERRVGLSSLDFIHGCLQKEVLFTRARQAQGAPTVASRLLTRFHSYLKRFDLEIPKEERFIQLAKHTHIPEKRVMLTPPAPKPPESLRPRRLSITDITTLMHDPYSVYAKHVLKLKPLKPLNHTPGTLEFGIFIHGVLEQLVGDEITLENGLRLGREIFDQYFNQSLEKILWWQRFENILHWFVETSHQNPTDTKHFVETRGSLEFKTPQGPFTLIGKADRIDVEKGKVTIIDYKTGTPPTQKDLEKGLAPQLPLEALILAFGHFEGLPPATTQKLSFWRLSGDLEGGMITSYTKNIPTLIETTKTGLETLVATFEKSHTPYLSIPFETGLYDDYHHLARTKEWSLNTGNAS